VVRILQVCNIRTYLNVNGAAVTFVDLDEAGPITIATFNLRGSNTRKLIPKEAEVILYKNSSAVGSVNLPFASVFSLQYR
jgi:hypothetical protein